MFIRKKDLEQIKEVIEEIRQETDERLKMVGRGYHSRFTKVEERLDRIEDILTSVSVDKEKVEGSEPYIRIIGENWSTDGLELKLEWNDSLISNLKQSGYVGVDEEEIIERYLYDIFNTKLSESEIAK